MDIALFCSEAVAKLPDVNVKYLVNESSAQALEMILGDETVEAVVDCTAVLSVEEALRVLRSGKKLVTSDVVLVAENYAVLNNAAAESGTALHWESALAGGAKWLEEAGKSNRFTGILTEGNDFAREAAACLALASHSFGIAMPVKEVHSFSLANLTEQDLEVARQHGFVCRLISSAHKTEVGTTAYVEPSFVRPEHFLAEGNCTLAVETQNGGFEYHEARPAGLEAMAEACHSEMKAVHVEEVENENTIDIKPYYIRFAGQSGGWLDIVTRERWGDGVLTMPVSVKAIHSWAHHALRYDPDMFFAAVVR